MKGLLVKDFRLLSNQKQFFLWVFVIVLMLVAAGQDALFVISYCTMLGAFFTLSTISYDEFNHGYEFLFTMPVSRRGYAAEKYLFGFLAGGGIWLVTTCAGALYTYLREPGTDMAEWFMAAVLALLLLGTILAVMLPVQLKFGMEKGRIATVVFMLVFFALLAMIKRWKESWGTPHWNLDWAYSMGMADWLLLTAVVFVVVVGISLSASIYIIEKKQF